MNVSNPGRLARLNDLVRAGGSAVATTLVVSLLLAVWTTAPASASSSSALRLVTYRGYTFHLPRAWPVVNLAAHPDTCVLLTRHALYLGTPGASQNCPGNGAGQVTEAVVVQPSAGTGTAQSVLNPTAQQISVTAPRIRATATYGSDKAQILAILASAALPAPVTQAARPSSAIQPHSVPGGGSTSYQGNGFDTCAAPSSSVMSSWLSSPYRAVGIYIGGADRACAQANLTAAWVSQQYSAGWRFIPLYVGIQGAYGQISSPASQASASASDAVAQAQSLGFGPGALIYYDMEGGSGGNAMSTVLSYLSDWTADLHALGYKSGVYSSSSYAVAALASNYTSYTMPDVIYDALWNGEANTSDPVIGASEWANHQRVHQYQGGVNQTYGGVTQNIDLDYLDVIVPAATAPAPPLVGFMTPGGGFYVKEGGLSAAWTQEEASGVSSIALASDGSHGPLIGFRSTGGGFYVKEGGLSAAWTQEEASGVASIALASDSSHGPLIGFRSTGGGFYVKEGGLSAAWTQEEAAGVAAIALASDSSHGPLIGFESTSGGFYVKEGGLSAAWTQEEAAGVAAIALGSDGSNGPLIGFRTPAGGSYAKKGGLSTPWTQEEAAGVAAIALAPSSGD